MKQPTCMYMYSSITHFLMKQKFEIHDCVLPITYHMNMMYNLMRVCFFLEVALQLLDLNWGHHRDRMVVGFTTT
jgi:hypothetical protein